MAVVSRGPCEHRKALHAGPMEGPKTLGGTPVWGSNHCLESQEWDFGLSWFYFISDRISCF